MDFRNGALLLVAIGVATTQPAYAEKEKARRIVRTCEASLPRLKSSEAQKKLLDVQILVSADTILQLMDIYPNRDLSHEQQQKLHNAAVVFQGLSEMETSNRSKFKAAGEFLLTRSKNYRASLPNWAETLNSAMQILRQD